MLFYFVKQKAMYVIQIKIDTKVTRICTKHPLVDLDFPKSLLPSDAKYVNQLYFGSGARPEAGLLVNLYEGTTKTGGDSICFLLKHLLFLF